MKSKIILTLAMLAIVGSVFAQPPNPTHQTTSAAALAMDVSKFLASHLPDKKTMRAGADRLARKYVDQLRGFGGKIGALETEAGARFGQLDWKQKMNLAMELYRVRSSLDLMCLLSPEVLKELTGFELPDLRSWVSRLGSVQAKMIGSCRL